MQLTVTVSSLAFPGPQSFATWVQEQLVTMVTVNQLLLRKRLVPSLYSSGVRFEVEAPGVESFIDALSVLTLPRPSATNPTPHVKWGDCAHLAAWRCADLRHTGEDPNASIRVFWRTPEMYHVQVRRSKRIAQPLVDDPFVEDPSRLLGMKG